MKKVLVGLLLVVALLAFAAEATFSIGTKITYTGTVYFELVAYPKGVDATGTHSLDAAVSISLSPTSVSAAGATFSLSYTLDFTATLGRTTSIPVNFSLSRIDFKTDFFNATWFNSRQFVSDYFTGRIYNADGSVADWQAAFRAQFTDTLLLSFPNIADVFFVDKGTEGNVSWFSDMVLVRRIIDPFTVILGLYNSGDTATYEMGAHIAGTVDLGFFKPTLRLFGGMVEDGGNLVPAYEFRLTGTITLIPNILTVAPTVRFTDKLEKLDYISNTLLPDQRFVQAVVTFTDKLGVITPTIKITPRYNFLTDKFTLRLDEASLKADFGIIYAYAAITNADVLTPANKYDLYSEASFKLDPVTVSGKAYWADLSQLDKFSYINAKAAVTLKPLYVEGNLGWIQGKNGYNVIAKYDLTQNVYLSGFYGTINDLNADGVYGTGEYLTDPDWNFKLVYTAKF